jgi:flagellar basal body-associated protein FliL
MVRRNNGATIVESAASLSLLLPLTILIIFVALEVGYSYLIKTSLSHAARQAARELAVAYGGDPAIAQNKAAQEAVLNHVRIPYMVHDNHQFEEVRFDSSQSPHTVTVHVRYVSGKYGLPRFPNPDPLQMGDKMQIASTATYRLE